MRVCFVAHNAFGALTGIGQNHAGGIERQQALMSTWLAQRGHDVSMITWNEGIAAGTRAAGVQLHPMCAKSDGVPILRFVHPRWTSLNSALRSADAELYYYNCGDLGLGQLALWTRRHGRQLVFSVPSDADCEPSLPNLHGARERILYRYGLRHCNHIVAQTNKQKRLIEANFGLEATILPMPCAGYEPSEQTCTRPRIVWIGRISPEKRPDWLLDVAERLPQYDFEIVGAPNNDSEYARSVVQRARKVPNVTLAGRVAYEDMANHYAGAAALCSTSVYEGFPNIYLEAWSAAVPTVVTCDPDGIIAAHGLGGVGGNPDELAGAIRALVDDPARRRRAGLDARAYFADHHQLDHAMERFERFFQESIQGQTDP